MSQVRSENLGDKIVVASLGVLAGVLSNFVAAIYLKMYGGAVTSMTTFHDRLVATHYLHFGNFLVAKIDDVRTREETLARMAESLAKSRGAEDVVGEK
jgi:hypothetical protein